ncbi:hypothetical protein UNSWCS_2092 [Campylobacter concisus UNSWCS]|uniref:Uncharacterized protein n=1 Tax=Campylobacter concisus UNSWCS TaxID=1242968 RepID=U2G9L4_9BACT|nr:hypothetical protein UNSWCS_2092 [Campylobacter concisus UNSWCS]
MASFKFEFSIVQITSPIFDTPSIISFRSASAPSGTSIVGVKSFLEYVFKIAVTLLILCVMPAKKLFSSVFNSAKDGLFGFWFITTPNLPLLTVLTMALSSLIIALSFLIPSTTSLIFSLITLLICPNSSSLFISNLAGASALYVTNLNTSVNLSCMVLIGFKELFKRNKTNADKITIKITAIIACILSNGIVFDVNTSFCIADIASQPRSFSSMKSAYLSSPFVFL